MFTQLYESMLLGYETKVLSHVQPAKYQQQCSYDIGHMDGPAKDKKENCSLIHTKFKTMYSRWKPKQVSYKSITNSTQKKRITKVT